ncbi:MAG TPA: hypothetical protein VGU23_06050 [Acidobacteriaceae bacterium]|nr:hypothetical protein [Acidobacteriaceae bacterium]
MTQPTRIIDATKRNEISEYLSKSEGRQKIYDCIYRGGNQPKSAELIAEKIKLTTIRVLQLATPMAHEGYIVEQKVNGIKAFAKQKDLVAHRDSILRLARNRTRLKTLANAKIGRMSVTLNTSGRTRAIRVDLITIDDIENFAKVSKVTFTRANGLKPPRLREKVFKYGLAKILGETGEFHDWGGEKNDLYSVNLMIKSKRFKSAIALKGIGTKPPLSIKKLGKNADQIPRLFESTAEVFLIQFEGQILEEVIGQMETYAIRKSKESGKWIRYGVIGGDDSARLRIAYPSYFME